MTLGEQIEFPPIETATEEGLLACGGELTPDWLLAAYRQGIFPWPVGDPPLLENAWWCPDPRAVMEFDDLYVSRRLARTMRSGRFTVTHDADFEAVLEGCAQPRDDGGTWLTVPLQRGFTKLHHMGLAHSVEIWHGGQLVGGVYGLALGGYFSAESMFHTERDASKVALVHLMRHLQQQGFTLVDLQVLTDHTLSMGASEITRRVFVQRLNEALTGDVKF